ncbi:MAG: exopolysaccharide biosynthesis polyprenyl glycosylphosphotransferase [Candidatus Terrybacteria bacterium]|nr:exopolysaccharide biosynthesis polyprenyl glycosylphosphotransferase [Candidatus Terrybacteria bacterium]
MIQGNRYKKFILLLGDLALLYLGLFLSLTVRYASPPSANLWNQHFLPFSIINLLWILIFYIAGFYDIEKKFFTTLTNIIEAIIAGGIAAVLIFYLIPYFGIAPKTILAIEIFIASILIWIWRKLFFYLLYKTTKIKIFFLDGAEKIIPNFGYEIVKEISAANIIVVSEKEKQNPKTAKFLYDMVLAGKTVIDFENFYESVTGKIPVSIISETWFLENLRETNKQTFEKFKRGFDIIFALLLFIPFLIIYPFAVLVIKLESKGPVFYKQKRIGKNGNVFEIVKFRSMIDNAEKNGAQWAKENDSRITFAGNVLRKTRLDELPQIINVIKGNLSFIGPRPERPEFMKELNEKVPHYSMRHLIKPGLSGWAQINFPYGASVEDAAEKLQYDLYYIKHRSLGLDLHIIFKTIKILLTAAGR